MGEPRPRLTQETSLEFSYLYHRPTLGDYIINLARPGQECPPIFYSFTSISWIGSVECKGVICSLHLVLVTRVHGNWDSENPATRRNL
jgi:hypothetical protein